jgi:hypothetical protein
MASRDFYTMRWGGLWGNGVPVAYSSEVLRLLWQSEAKTIYLNSKSKGCPVTFAQAVDQAVDNRINSVGDKPTDRYTRHDANEFRDTPLERDLSKTSVI